ncbi:MAG: DUF4838 domain-containing protein [Phycisphaerales bacterium]|nr:DUF4838 domain-containing protein [Phycisphaerales bacterium]
MQSVLTHVILPCLTVLAVSPDASWIIVHDGHSSYDIVVAEDALPTTRLAASELREYIGRATGVALELVSSPRSGRHAIHVRSDAELPRNGFTIDATDDGDIVLRGHDGPGTDPGVDNARPVLRGTCHAVYEFLERFAGVRWFWNEPLGEIVPPSRRLTVPRGISVRQAPAFAYRALANGPPGTLHGEWARRNRLGADRGMHHGHYVHRLLKVADWARRGHPEYAALIDGRRKTDGEHVCLSNPEVVRIVAGESARAFRREPNLNMMSISLPDGHDFCTCAQCMALDTAGDEKNRASRVFHFYNQVAESLAGEFGDRKLGGYVYSEYIQPPARPIRIHPMMALVVAPNSATYLSDPNRRRQSDELNATWAGLHDEVYAYDTFYLVSLHWGLPVPIGQPAVDLVQSYATIGFRGAYLYIAPTWETGGADAYVLTKLLWNPEADVERIGDEYYGLLYQRAAPPVRRYFEIAEDCWRATVIVDKAASRALAANIKSGSGSDRRLANLILGYGPRLTELEECVADAESLTGGDEQVRQRVERIRDNFRLTFTTIRGLQYAADYEASRSDRAAALAELKKLAGERDALLDKMASSYGQQLVEWVRGGDEGSDSPLRPGSRLRGPTDGAP